MKIDTRTCGLLVCLFFVLSCLVSPEEDAGAAERVEEKQELVFVDVESFSRQRHRLLQFFIASTRLRLLTQTLLFQQFNANCSEHF